MKSTASPMNPPASSLPTVVHADGVALLAVAEGDADHQPIESVLNHIFSCARCGAILREMRSGLALLTIPARPITAAPITARTNAAPTRRKAAGGTVLDPMELLAEPGANGGIDADVGYDRSRKLIVKLLIIGALLVIGMLWLRSFVAGMH